MLRGAWRAAVHGVAEESDVTEATYHAYVPSKFAKMWKSRSQKVDSVLEHGRMVS